MKIENLREEVKKAGEIAKAYPEGSYYMGVYAGNREIGAITDMIPFKEMNAIVCLYTKNIPHASPYGGGYEAGVGGLKRHMLNQRDTLTVNQMLDYSDFVKTRHGQYNSQGPFTGMDIYACEESQYKKAAMANNFSSPSRVSFGLRMRFAKYIMQTSCKKVICVKADSYDEREEDNHKHVESCWLEIEQ